MFTALACWVALGFVVGVIASKLVPLDGDDPRLGTGVSVIGAVVGGFLYVSRTDGPRNTFDAYSVVAAAVGAALAVGGWHVARRFAART